MDTLLGTDVSAAQGTHLDWSKVAATGVRFAICKATEHVAFNDKTFAHNAAGAAQAGLFVGSYHVLHPDADPDRQARHYADVASGATTLPPVLDLELRGTLRGDEVARRALAFIELTEALWKKPCIVYTANWFWAEIGNPAGLEFATRPLWVAHYGVKMPTLPRPWHDRGWAFWQYDGNGGRRLPGTDADFDWFHGTEDDLRALATRTLDPCAA